MLAEDPAQALEDAAGYTFGGLADGEASLTLLGQALGGEPDWRPIHRLCPWRTLFKRESARPCCWRRPIQKSPGRRPGL